MKIDSNEVGLAIHLTMRTLVDSYFSSKDRLSLRHPIQESFTLSQESLYKGLHKETMLRQWLCIETLLRATGGCVGDVCEGDVALQEKLESIVSDCKGKSIDELFEGEEV